jgi:ElaB/YqjD/DUF883 family membrane-anchored ribosome-binding protein
MTNTNTDKTAHETVDRMASGAHEAVDRFAKATNDTADNLEAKGQQLKEVQELWFDNVREYVRANPGTSLGIALAAGFLASRILSSR